MINITFYFTDINLKCAVTLKHFLLFHLYGTLYADTDGTIMTHQLCRVKCSNLEVCTCSFLLMGIPVAVNTQDVVGYFPVLLWVHLIQHDEEQIKTRQQRVLQANVLHGRLILIILQTKTDKLINVKCKEMTGYYL